MSDTLKEAKRLHQLGFAILWLHKKSKRPIKIGWTTGPRESWEELKATYQEGYNLGVRLGSPSELTYYEGLKKRNGYLTVIDVDVKGSEKRHLKEALAALARVTGGATFPEVRSGRGGGSRHLYCLTPRPFKTWNPAASEEMIKVHMPSKSVSKKELALLTKKEIESDIRISRAWEISLYSDGRQVVLPPSIHPDSGKPYLWKSPIESVSELPFMEFENPKGDEAESKKKRAAPKDSGDAPDLDDDTFQVAVDETLDVRWLPGLSDEVRAAIVSGVGVSDRSGYLLRAAHALLSAGLDRDGILTVLSDRSTFLGECAYDHAQTSSRLRAMRWLWNYTVKRVMRERDPALAFKDQPIEYAAELGEEDAKAQKAEHDAEKSAVLDRTEKGGVRSTLNNCLILLSRAVSGAPLVGRNEFAANDYYLTDTPWRSKKGDAVTDIDIVRIKKYLARSTGVEFSDNTINQALMGIADENRFHPVREWIKRLDWDGTPRLETWLQDYAGAEGPEDYLRAVSRKVLVAMVKRVFEPGCKFDHVLILEGDQGVGKSTLLRNLTGEWFSDATLNIGDKDAVLTMQSKWLIELGELSALNRSEVETMKAFISQQTDRIRAPYGKRVEEFPRQCVFTGSTNKDEYLKDETGNRRFWPVKCGVIRYMEIADAREQLFAEAYAFYQLGEPLYLETPELNAAALEEQHMRSEVDEWLSAIRDIVSGEIFPLNGFEIRDVSKNMEFLGAHRLTPFDQQRIGKCLRLLGFEKYQEGGGLRRKLWRKGRKFNPEGWNLAEPCRTLDQGSSKNEKSPLENDDF